MLLPLRRSSTKPRLFQLRQMRGDAALAHAENLLQFGDGQLFALTSNKIRRRLGSASRRRFLRIDAMGSSVLLYQHI